MRYNERSNERIEMSEEIVVVEVDDLPTIHKFGKYALGCLVAFAATQLADKLYDMAYTMYKAQKASSGR
jgi:hypothetical protein